MTASSAVRRDNGSIAKRVSETVSTALRTDQTIAQDALLLPAMIAGEVADVLAQLTPDGQKRLNRHSAELARHVRRLVEDYGDRPPVKKMRIQAPAETEPSAGEGLGRLLTADEAEAELLPLGVKRKLTDWAGPVAGATELSRTHGIARSSLNRWHHDGDVIGLLKGTKKHAYPVEQFIDGRPVRGLREIGKLAGHPRTAWLWLIQPNPMLEGARPIDRVKQDRVDEVLDFARSYFLPQ